jgi:hypothetical protein
MWARAVAPPHELVWLVPLRDRINSTQPRARDNLTARCVPSLISHELPDETSRSGR